MTEKTENPNSTSKTIDLEIAFKGYIFVFTDGKNEIEAQGSAVSGKEKIYFNGDIISESRNMSFTSHHEFTVDENDYIITFNMKSWLRGHLECSLHKNGQIIGHEEKSMYSGSKKMMVSTLLLSLGVGGLIGYSTGFGLSALFKWLGM